MRTPFIAAFILYLCLAGITNAAELDNYYLAQFGEVAAHIDKAASKSAFAPQLRKCGLPIRKALRSDWEKLESSTRKTLAKYLAKPVLASEATLTSSAGHFIIHYATTGSDLPAPVAPYNVTSWVQKVADTFEEVYTKEVTSLGYSPPAAPYPVYLQQLASQSAFGFTDPDILTGQSATSYITIDNDFADLLYHPYNGLSALQITAAHEFHHAIQFHYNYFFETWYAEATSTWMEDEAYDSVNQLYNYSRDYLLSPAESLNTPTDGGYSRWIFNRLLAENHTAASIRLIWDKLRSTSSNGGDIPMIPVINSSLNDQAGSFATEFLSFAKRLYTRNWTSHTNELSLLYQVPLTINATYSTYPVNNSSTVKPTVTLSAYSFGYYKFMPGSSAPINLNITFTSTGSLSITAFKKTTGNIITEYPLTTNGGTLTIDSFGVAGTAETALLICNPTAAPATVSFSTDGTTPPPTTTNSSGGGGGCFIATAAYGSYLHPKVMILREFRDRYLLTNRPGRALVAAYYRISPPIAEFISRHELLQFIIRLLLVPVIFTVEHLWLMLTTLILLTGGCSLHLKRKRKLQNCEGAC